MAASILGMLGNGAPAGRVVPIFGCHHCTLGAPPLRVIYRFTLAKLCLPVQIAMLCFLTFGISKTLFLSQHPMCWYGYNALPFVIKQAIIFIMGHYFYNRVRCVIFATLKNNAKIM
jgi:hypothetical protein